MKTLHVDCGREMGGGQWQVLYLVERLNDAVLLAAKESPLFHEARKRGLDVRPLSFLSLLRAARRADLMHAHDSRAHSMLAIAGGVPLVVSRRVGFVGRRGFFSDWKYARARIYIAISRYVAMRLNDRGFKWPLIRVVYDGVPIPPRPSAKTGGVVAIAKTGCDAVESVARSLNVPIRLVTDLWDDLATASVCVYLSEMEGLGSGAIAAMACGVPVIASRVGGLPEVIEHGKTGLLIDSPGELQPALRRLMQNADEAAEMGMRAREVARQKFSVEAMVAGTVAVYEEVLR